jgi:hypothetical protein
LVISINTGSYPTVFGEIGIPFDMNNKRSYGDGNYTQQIKAMDANMYALERNLLNFTLWNYCSDNNHRWGDQWNGEDLSLWSRDAAQHSSSDINSGGRAVAAFVRPYPILTPGTPLTLSFDISQRVFEYTFQHKIGSTDANSVTEIYLPSFHYPLVQNLDIYVSCGTYQVYPDIQRLVWHCGCCGEDIEHNDYGSENALLPGKLGTCITHKIVVTVQTRGGLSAAAIGTQTAAHKASCLEKACCVM